ncbi:hypothetical protein Cabther_A1488 [Chloracidobacterium thermophilum B]|uniref:Uncharacterized protein n=1 Tax=Chloracidobacterium thermophilum (strain B) TaxID=981222 RepID=G2LHH5_CHLTF|nr:hypothetical protein Cabther_A1488 [Chloracidobacterium thermophilum B]
MQTLYLFLSTKLSAKVSQFLAESHKDELFAPSLHLLFIAIREYKLYSKEPTLLSISSSHWSWPNTTSMLCQPGVYVALFDKKLLYIQF